jgi:CheY-like chemotaxis protein
MIDSSKSRTECKDPGAKPGAKPEPKKVFVVDDNHDECGELAEYIRRKGHFVTEIHDGITAITEIQAHKPELVLMDVHMPFCDGIRATELAQSLSPRTTIVLMSGYPEEVVRAKRASCDALKVLAKPLSLKEVALVVAAVLDRQT